MAISSSPSNFSRILISSPFFVKPNGLVLTSVKYNSANPLRLSNFASECSYRSASPPRRSSKRLVRVQATTLQVDEEKVVVEKSFNPKGFPEEEEGTSGTLPTGGSAQSSGLEKWTIKLEQSINIFLTDSVIKILDTLYHDRDYARFYVLETIARVPYFAFMSVLHLYESCGWWRRADYLKVHFAESWNEMHHLLIMEKIYGHKSIDIVTKEQLQDMWFYFLGCTCDIIKAAPCTGAAGFTLETYQELGGNSWWVDRFLAQHIAFFYYFMTVFMYMLSPRMAYHFSECVESHAFETYDKFIKTQGEELKKLPAPAVAVKYYTNDDMYLFDEFQTSRPPNSRRPKIDNLYDVFSNIREDEAEHCKTMKACQTHGNLRSPHSSPNEALEDDPGCVLPEADCEGIADCIKKSFR